MIEIKIRHYGYCSACSFYEATTTAPDGGERLAESSEQGSEDEAIGRLVQQNPDIFGEINVEYVGK